MRAHRYTAAESEPFHELLHNLTFLGEKGAERIEIHHFGNGNHIPKITKAPNWWGRLIEWLFGKNETLRIGPVATFVNAFVQENRALLESSDPLLTIYALRKISYRFSRHPQVLATVNSVLAVLEVAEQRRQEAVISRQNDTRRIEEENRGLQERFNRDKQENRHLEAQHIAELKALDPVIENMREETLATADSRARQDTQLGQSAADKEAKKILNRTAFISNWRNGNGFADIYNDHASKDVAIVCQDGHVFAHSQFLSGFQFFNNGTSDHMVKHIVLDKTYRKVDLSIFPKEVVEQFVIFQYDPKWFRLNDENLVDLYILADQFLDVHTDPLVKKGRTSPFMEAIAKLIVKEMTPETAWECLGNPILSGPLQEAAIELLRKEFPEGPVFFSELLKWAAQETNNDRDKMRDLLNAPCFGQASLLDKVPFREFRSAEIEERIGDLFELMAFEKLQELCQWFKTNRNVNFF